MTFSAGFGRLLALGSGFPIADRLDFGLPAAGRDDVADAFSEHRFRKRRDVRDRALGGIGFVFADDPERLLAAVVAPDGHGGAEPYFRCVGRGRHYPRARPAGGPVAQIASRRGKSSAIRRGLRDGVSFACLRQGILDLCEASLGNIIRMLGDRPLGHLEIVDVLFLDEGPAHGSLPSGGKRRKRNIFYAVPFLPDPRSIGFAENHDGRQQTEARRREGSWTARKAPQPIRARPRGGTSPDSEPAVLAISAGGHRSARSSILSRDHHPVDGVSSHPADSRASATAVSVRPVRGPAARRMVRLQIRLRAAAASGSRGDPGMAGGDDRESRSLWRPDREDKTGSLHGIPCRRWNWMAS